MENGDYYLGFGFYVGLNDASPASAASALAITCRHASTGKRSGARGLEGLGLRVLQMPGVLRSFREAYIDLQKPRDIIRDFHELFHRPLSPLRGNQILPLTQTVPNLGLIITGTGSGN